ncbi:MAG TPA: di-heme oxidoredictase family protein, partial [Kofleriaceae bacterium]|nr:di-heme oxidoredictase family protein [Kofleriaceae bacterium]
DRTSTGDARNPPSLLGAGVAQAIGEEMTADLARLRDAARARAHDTGQVVDVALETKGVSFGTLHVRPDGQLDTDDVHGIDSDLVVRPFGWKGTSATVADFVAEAAAVHFGIQTEGLAGAVAAGSSPDPLLLGSGPADDPDRDGITDELTAGQLTALAAHVALLELPIGGPHERPVDRTDPTGPTEPYLVDEWAHGREVLDQLGCTTCHVPRMVLARSTVTIRAPGAAAGVTVDLARDAEAPRLVYDAAAGGYPVFAFSDFKRHDLGDDNAALHLHQGIARRLYLTRRLWGVGASAPYFHDGRSPTIDDAIARHGGEAAFARTAWEAAPDEDRTALRVFLTALRRAPRITIP